VRIQSTPSSDTQNIRYDAAAEFPAGATRRALVTRHIEISSTPTGNES
jgi:hypothetical protein